MPIDFAPGWSALNLKVINNLEDLMRFAIVKHRAQIRGPNRVAQLKADIAVLEQAKADKDAKKVGAVFYKQHGEELEQLKVTHNALEKDLDRGKISGVVVRQVGDLQNPIGGTTTSKAQNFKMEDLHNDRLRYADKDMLKAHSGVAIMKAIIEAAPRFAADPRVAALFAQAVRKDGEPVVVTQGVHQSDDPHFDVLMPGEVQQYHLEVKLPGVDGAATLTVRSVSYMAGPRKSDGTWQVPPDVDGGPVFHAGS